MSIISSVANGSEIRETVPCGLDDWRSQQPCRFSDGFVCRFDSRAIQVGKVVCQQRHEVVKC
jgi:hypothetical protein